MILWSIGNPCLVRVRVPTRSRTPDPTPVIIPTYKPGYPEINLDVHFPQDPHWLKSVSSILVWYSLEIPVLDRHVG